MKTKVWFLAACLFIPSHFAFASSVSDQLKAWIEPHGFRVESSDFTELQEIISQKVKESDEPLLVGVLAHVLDMSPTHFDRLYGKFPELESLAKLKSLKGMSKEAQFKTEERVLKALQKVKKDNPEIPGSDWKTWKKFRVFKSAIAQMNADVREDFSNFIADSMANFAFATPAYKNIFLSRLYYFARYPTDELFSLDPIAYTDFTFARGKTVLTPMVFANHPIDGENEMNAFGFYTKSYAKVYGEQKPTKTQWTYQGQKFTANWSIDKKEDVVSKYIPRDSAPPYANLWANRSLTGMVIAGVNLGAADGKATLDQYVDYFTGQGFTFSKPQAVENSLKYFQELVESGELDYFIKEAHSDGDEKIFFRISKLSKVRIARKLLKNGNIETMILMYSDKKADTSNKKSSLITNQMFGEWIRAREASGGNEIIQFNAGCWSASGQAVTALEAARSKVLIVYAAKTAMNTFINDATQAPYQFLHSFRHGLSFNEIRKNMSREKEYREGTEDILLFTDDPEYENEITSRLRAPIEIQVQVLDSKGRPYSMDQEH